jgi:hypothetical protein
MRLVRRALSALIGLLAALPVAAAQTGLQVDVSAYDAAAGLSQALQKVVIHLHNHGPIRNGSVHLAEASSVKWPAAEGPGRRVRFTLPDASRVILGRRYGYYVDHVRADGIDVAAQPDRLTATIFLNATGPALVGKCVRLVSPAVACERLGERQMPGIEWTGARVDIDMVPIAHGGSIAFEATGVSIGGAFDIGQVCDLALIGARLCLTINNRTQALRLKLAAEIKASLNQPQVRRDVAAAFRQHLDTVAQVPVLAVRRVVMSESVLRIGFGFR